MEIKQNSGEAGQNSYLRDLPVKNVTIYHPEVSNPEESDSYAKEDNENYLSDRRIENEEDFPNYDFVSRTYTFENSDYDQVPNPSFQNSPSRQPPKTLQFEEIECPVCDGTGNSAGTTCEQTESIGPQQENFYKAVFTCANCGGLGRIRATTSNSIRPADSISANEINLVIPNVEDRSTSETTNNSLRSNNNNLNNEINEVSGISVDTADENIMNNGVVIISNPTDNSDSTIKETISTRSVNNPGIADNEANRNPPNNNNQPMDAKALSLSAQVAIFRRKSRHLRLRFKAAYFGFGSFGCFGGLTTCLGTFGCFGCCGMASTGAVTAGGIGGAGLCGCGGCGICAIAILAFFGILAAMVCCIGIVGFIGSFITLELIWPGFFCFDFFLLLFFCFDTFVLLFLDEYFSNLALEWDSLGFFL